MTDLKQAALLRQRAHAGQATQNPIRRDGDYIGFVGEQQFATEFGYTVDTSIRLSGDNGDFRTPLGTVDVKTATSLYGLLVDSKSKHFSDIYVLALFDEDDDSATLIGWEHGYRVRLAPKKPGKNGYVNHHIDAEKLRSIEHLRCLMFPALGTRREK